MKVTLVTPGVNSLVNSKYSVFVEVNYIEEYSKYRNECECNLRFQEVWKDFGLTKECP